MSQQKEKFVSIRDIENAVEESVTYFKERYLDFVNNFLTYERYAEYYNCSVSAAKKEIALGKKLQEAEWNKAKGK